jgi:hypothetical protein
MLSVAKTRYAAYRPAPRLAVWSHEIGEPNAPLTDAGPNR